MTAIKVKDLSFAYNGFPVLEDISFSIQEGDFVAVIGPNGSGKTTLAKLLLGMLAPQKGTIQLFGNEISHEQVSKWIGYVPQKISIDKLFPATVDEILALNGPLDHHLHQRLGIEAFHNKRFTELSGGQQQRVVIALALQANPKILILDEPSVGIDLKTQREFYALLKQLNDKENVTIMLITHDVGMIPSYCKSVLCINHKVCCYGPASETPELVKKTYGQLAVMHHHHE